MIGNAFINDGYITAETENDQFYYEFKKSNENFVT